MQAVIMAGGKGTRLLSITNDETPKPMVPIAGKPILQWQVECLKANGITEIIIVVGHLGEQIEQFFRDGSDFGVHVSYYHERQPLGTAGALGELQERISDDYFLLVFGDVIFDVDIARMEGCHKRKKAVATLFAHPNSHPADSDIIITDENSWVVQFDSKNNQRDYWYHNCVNAGFYILNKEACRLAERGRKADLEKDILIPFVQRGAGVYAYISPEYIKDVGTPERIESAENELIKGYVSSRNLKNRQKCIFVDRDGTINRYNGLISKEDDFVLEVGTIEAVKAINASGYLVIVITNQPVVARGLCSIADVDNIHNKMQTLLGQQGAYLDDICFCPHHPDKGYPEENTDYKIHCKCRKPQTGLIDACVEKYHIDTSVSWMIGDTTMDIQTGLNVGLHTALVLTGEAGRDEKYEVSPDLTADNLLRAVEMILN